MAIVPLTSTAAAFSVLGTVCVRAAPPPLPTSIAATALEVNGAWWLVTGTCIGIVIKRIHRLYLYVQYIFTVQ